MSDYQKGYAAGRRRLRRDDEWAQREFMREEFERAVFIAILPELVRAPWQTGGETWKGMDEFVSGALKFAQKSSTKFSFPVLPSPNQENPNG